MRRDGEPDAEIVEGTVSTGDGLELFWRGWPPPAPAGVLLIVHGLAEHSGRYGHVGRYAAARGWAAPEGLAGIAVTSPFLDTHPARRPSAAFSTSRSSPASTDGSRPGFRTP